MYRKEEKEEKIVDKRSCVNRAIKGNFSFLSFFFSYRTSHLHCPTDRRTRSISASISLLMMGEHDYPFGGNENMEKDQNNRMDAYFVNTRFGCWPCSIRINDDSRIGCGNFLLICGMILIPGLIGMIGFEIDWIENFRGIGNCF